MVKKSRLGKTDFWNIKELKEQVSSRSITPTCCVERGSRASAGVGVRASARTALICSAAWRTRPTEASWVSTQTNAKPCTWEG